MESREARRVVKELMSRLRPIVPLLRDTSKLVANKMASGCIVKPAESSHVCKAIFSREPAAGLTDLTDLNVRMGSEANASKDGSGVALRDAGGVGLALPSAASWTGAWRTGGGDGPYHHAPSLPHLLRLCSRAFSTLRRSNAARYLS